VAHSYREQSEPERERRHRDIERRFRHLLPPDQDEAAAGECTPPLDVLETAEGVEVVMDVPGVPLEALRVLFSHGTLVVAGRKLPAGCAHREAAFHLAERSFGRFARAVRLGGAFDAGQACATLAAGELRIVIPRIEERRGRDIPIPITRRG
jgi:HSP20 family protein